MNRWVHASFKTIWTLGEAKTKFFPLCPECLQRFILGCLVLLATSSSCCCFCWLCCPFACGSNGRKQIWGEWKTAVCWLRILICHQCCCFACDWFEWPGIGTSPWELTRFPRLCRRRDYGGGASGRYEPMGRYDDPPRGPPSSRYDDPPRGPSMSSRYDDPPRGPPSKWRFQAAVFVVRGLCAIATCTCVCAPAGVVGVVLQHHQVPSWAAPQGSTCYLCCLPPPPGWEHSGKRSRCWLMRPSPGKTAPPGPPHPEPEMEVAVWCELWTSMLWGNIGSDPHKTSKNVTMWCITITSTVWWCVCAPCSRKKSVPRLSGPLAVYFRNVKVPISRNWFRKQLSGVKNQKV